MQMDFTQEEYQSVAKTVSTRRTFKVIGDPQDPVCFAPDLVRQCRAHVWDAIESANLAPFHYDRGLDEVPQPWRVDVLWHEACQFVADHFFDWFDDIKPGNKLPGMLSACGACVVVSWLPQFNFVDDDVVTDRGDDNLAVSKRLQIDQEHLAATAAYVQNLLLLLTARNMGTYWSSGGQFRTAKMKEKIGIDPRGSVLAAVFVDFDPLKDAATEETQRHRIAGKLYGKRASLQHWCKKVTLP